MAQELNAKVLSQQTSLVARRLGYEDFLREYDGQHAEWIDFEIIEPMSVSRKHDDLTGFLRAVLRIYVESRNLGTIHGEPYQMKMTLPNGVHGREPDIFFVKRENAARIKPKFFDGAADLTIEIVSQESYARDTQDKFDEYERAGVAEYWIINPERETAEFYGLNQSGQYEPLPPDANGKFRSRVLTDLELKIEWLWQEPLPNVIEVLKEWKIV